MSDIEVLSTHDGEVLCALDRDISDDTFFEGLIETEANLLEARGVEETWAFELPFLSHDAWRHFGHTAPSTTSR